MSRLQVADFKAMIGDASDVLSRIPDVMMNEFQVADFKAMIGDASDVLSRIPGAGLKTATKLLFSMILS
eukprot:gene28600-31767_t